MEHTRLKKIDLVLREGRGNNMDLINDNRAGFLALAEEKLLNNEPIAEVIDILMQNLYEMRQQLSFEDWRQFATVDCRRHQIMKILQQDPFIWRALNKPRGYAGDGETLDFIFAPEDGFTPKALQEASEIGQKLYSHTANTVVPRAVRARRRFIVERINQIAARQTNLHVLSIACGHLREAKYITALHDGQIGRFVAVDQDQENLTTVERDFENLGVEAVTGSVRDMLRGRLPSGTFDYIYAAGLYDYLTLPIAQRVTEILFALLNPGGRLLLANYVPGVAYAGFIEAILDWWLIYRSKSELLTIADTLSEEQFVSYNIFLEEHRYIAMLEIERKG
jgi:extracellular factor (EF) 3-hydroxypalmitic acid methyl ester biosynthesis protein